MEESSASDDRLRSLTDEELEEYELVLEEYLAIYEDQIELLRQQGLASGAMAAVQGKKTRRSAIRLAVSVLGGSVAAYFVPWVAIPFAAWAAAETGYAAALNDSVDKTPLMLPGGSPYEHRRNTQNALRRVSREWRRRSRASAR